LSFVQDPVEPKLMFCGTEFGLYVSIDAGKNWSRWTNGYPTVSTYDLAIHPREHDLIIGTFGRSLWVLDDIRPLREIAAKGVSELRKQVRLFPIPDAYLSNVKEGSGTRFTGNQMFKGQNRPFGSMISFALAKWPVKDSAIQASGKDSIQVEIKNESGKVVRHLKLAPTIGVNRMVWQLEGDGTRFPLTPKPASETPPPPGMYVQPGTYTVRVDYGAFSDSQQVKVLPDPRRTIDLAGVEKWHQSADEYFNLVTTVTISTDILRDAKDRMNVLDKLVAVQVKDTTVKRRYEENRKVIGKEIDSIMAKLTAPEDAQGIYEDPAQLMQKLQNVAFYLDPAFGTPNPPSGAPPSTFAMAFKNVMADAKLFNQSVSKWKETSWKRFEDMVKGLDLDLLRPLGVD
jgi:hypothetical protein